MLQQNLYNTTSKSNQTSSSLNLLTIPPLQTTPPPICATHCAIHNREGTTKGHGATAARPRQRRLGPPIYREEWEKKKPVAAGLFGTTRAAVRKRRRATIVDLLAVVFSGEGRQRGEAERRLLWCTRERVEGKRGLQQGI